MSEIYVLSVFVYFWHFKCYQFLYISDISSAISFCIFLTFQVLSVFVYFWHFKCYQHLKCQKCTKTDSTWNVRNIQKLIALEMSEIYNIIISCLIFRHFYDFVHFRYVRLMCTSIKMYNSVHLYTMYGKGQLSQTKYLTLLLSKQIHLYPFCKSKFKMQY
jgi:hypothetical protein